MGKKREKTTLRKSSRKFTLISAFITSVLMLIIVLPSVACLGISPANKAIQIVPGKEQKVVYKIYNEDGKPRILDVNITGQLSQYVKADKKEIIFKQNEKIKDLVLVLNIPKSIDKNKIKDSSINIVVEERSKKINLNSRLKLNIPTAYLIKLADNVKKEKKEINKENSLNAISFEKIGKIIGSIKGKKKMLVNIIVVALILSIVALLAFSRKTSGIEETDKAINDMIDKNKNSITTTTQSYQTKSIKENYPKTAFFTSEGLALKDINDLFFYLKNINDNVFYRYVNNDKNEFALWLSKIPNETSLALEIYDITDRKKMMDIIKKHIMLRKAIEIEKNSNVSIYNEVKKIEQGFDDGFNNIQ